MVEKLNQNENLSGLEMVINEIIPELSALKENVLSTQSNEKNLENAPGEDPDSLENFGKECKKMAIEITPKVREDYKHKFGIEKTKLMLNDGMKGWDFAENLMDDLGNDILDLVDVESVDLCIKFYWSQLIGDKSIDMLLTDEEKKETMDALKNFLGKLSNCITKYAERFKIMFQQGLENNFNDVPEPIKSRFIKNKDKIEELVGNLGELSGIGVTDLFGSINNNTQLNKIYDRFMEDISKNIILAAGLRDIFGFFPLSREYEGKKNGVKMFETTDSDSIVKNINKLPTSSCVSFKTTSTKIELYSNRKVRLGNLYSDSSLDNLKWSIKSGKLLIKDEKGNIIMDNIDWHMEENITYINQDLADYLSKYDINHWGRVLTLPKLTGVDNNSLTKLKGFGLNLEAKKTLDNIEFAKELAKFGGENIDLGGLKAITPEIARELVKFNGELYLYGLKSITPEVAREFAISHCSRISLYGLDNVDDEVAQILSGIKTKLIVKDSIMKRINEVEGSLKVKTIQRAIEGTKTEIDWKGQRGNIEYDTGTKVLKSWGKMVKVDEISEKSVILSGLDLYLGLEEGIWLANFKNWLKKTYGNKKVEFKRDLINKSMSLKKTFVIDGTMLITREELQKRIPQCLDDVVMERITAWLNK